MANGKRSLFSSIFGIGKNQNKEAEEAAEIEARHKLEERIQRVLAEASRAPEPILEEEHVAMIAQEQEPEYVAEILPITASVSSRRKVPAPVDFWPSNAEVEQRYAVNGR
jgi:hypothetical protein